MPQKVYRDSSAQRKIKLMKTVALFLSDETTTRRLALAFRNRCLVRRFDGFESARKKLSMDKIMALVVDMRGRAGPTSATVVETITQLHKAWPSIPIVGYVNFSPHRMRDVLDAARAGASEIILDEFDDLDRIANKIADLGTSIDATTQLDVVIQTYVPEHLHEFFRFCVANAQHPVEVESAVIRMHKSRKTLANWLAAANFPTPARVVMWMRVLIAARMLEDTTRPLETIARELHYQSGTALRNMMRRYVDCTPEILRKRGGFQYALQMFVKELTAAKKQSVTKRVTKGAAKKHVAR